MIKSIPKQLYNHNQRQSFSLPFPKKVMRSFSIWKANSINFTDSIRKCWTSKQTGKSNAKSMSNYLNYFRRKLKMKEEKITELKNML